MRNRAVRLMPIGVLLLFAGVFWQMNGGAERVSHAGLAYPAENFSSGQAYRVLKVVDGATIKIDYKGKTESVRLIGVDRILGERGVGVYEESAARRVCLLALWQ